MTVFLLFLFSLPRSQTSLTLTQYSLSRRAFTVTLLTGRVFPRASGEFSGFSRGADFSQLTVTEIVFGPNEASVANPWLSHGDGRVEQSIKDASLRVGIADIAEGQTEWVSHEE